MSRARCRTSRVERRTKVAVTPGSQCRILSVTPRNSELGTRRSSRAQSTSLGRAGYSGGPLLVKSEKWKVRPADVHAYGVGLPVSTYKTRARGLWGVRLEAC